jgi:hypothetical protein
LLWGNYVKQKDWTYKDLIAEKRKKERDARNKKPQD